MGKAIPVLVLLIYLAISACSSDTGTDNPADGDALTDGDSIGDGDGIADGDISDGDASDGDVPDGDAVDGEIADGDEEDGDAIDGDQLDGDLPDGDLTDSDMSDGDALDGDILDGDSVDGDAPDGDAIDGDQDPLLLSEDFSYTSLDEALAAGWSIEYAPDYVPGHITWSIDEGVLEAEANGEQGKIGFSYFMFNGLDVSNATIEVAFTIIFEGTTWGGFRYRNVQIDICPDHIGAVDGSGVDLPGLPGSGVYQIRMIFYPETQSENAKWDLFIDEEQKLWGLDLLPLEPLGTSLGFVSSHSFGVAGFDDLTVRRVDAK